MVRKKPKTNVIHAGHNVHILRNQIPDESVGLIYLDPPFFSGSNYDIVWGNGTEMQAYEDAGMYWQSQEIDEETLDAEFERMLNVIDPDNTLDDEERSDMKSKLRQEKQGIISKGDITGYIHYMAPILRELHRVLKPTGSIYLHCDWHANAHLRILIDEIFGANNFLGEIIWRYRTYQGQVTRYFPRKHDVLLFYRKDNEHTFNLEYQDNIEDTINYNRWKKYVVDGNKIKGDYYPETDTRFMAYYKRWVRENGRNPTNTDVILELTGYVVDDVWDIKAVDPKSKERLGYPTQKPEALLERIILASSNEGDIVLDPFVGGGTACVVAHRLGRKYIGIDISPRACAMTVRNFERYGVTIDYKKQLNFPYEKVITTMELMAELGLMPHAKYEKWVRNALGFKDKKRSDRIGVDGIKYKDKKIAGKLVFDEFLEVKKWKHKVGRSVVSKLAGDMQAHGVRKGIIVANQFSRDALRRVDVLTKEGVHIKLRLIDDVVEQNEELMKDPTLIDFYTEEENK